MGVDIYGIAPALEEFVLPENPTEEQLREYETKLAAERHRVPGGYFGNNWWNWRPIHLLIDILNDAYQIGISADDIGSLGDNSGGGVRTPEQCQKLADHIDEYVKFMKLRDYKVVYLNSGSWYYDHGQKRLSMESESHRKVLTTIDEQFPRGLLFVKPVIDGVEYTPAHSTNIDNLLSFVAFLRHCNGFEVY